MPAKFKVCVGSKIAGWKSSTTSLNGKMLKRGVGDVLVLPALDAINPDFVLLLLRVETETEIMDDLSRATSEFAFCSIVGRVLPKIACSVDGICSLSMRLDRSIGIDDKNASKHL